MKFQIYGQSWNILFVREMWLYLTDLFLVLIIQLYENSDKFNIDD